MTQSIALRKKRFSKLLPILRKHYRNATLPLTYQKPFELFVAVVLSAQSTDKKVNEITPLLFKKYKTLDAFAKAPIAELQKDVSHVLFFRNKARYIKQGAIMLQDSYNGVIPNTMKELLTIPGLARKSANVLLYNLYGITDGIVTDTHMIRFARRFDLTEYKDALRIERDLMAIVPKKEWGTFGFKVSYYGREYGNPRGKKAIIEKDPLLKIYPKAKGYWPS
ncbi:MAG: endonuclease III [Alphaproteobacteria bacterium]|nr:endonuclease III [Alphaproteobacteria bacterium]